jgi:hypothetical protein
MRTLLPRWRAHAALEFGKRGVSNFVCLCDAAFWWIILLTFIATAKAPTAPVAAVPVAVGTVTDRVTIKIAG